MIVEFEDYYGNTIGAIHVREFGNTNDIDIYSVTGNISIADIDFDNIFNTNERKIRVQMEDKYEQENL